MLKSVGQLALAGVSLAVLAGCDAPKAPEPAPVVEAAVATPPPPKPFDSAEAMAAVDQKALCVLFSRAMTDAKTKVAKSDCAVSQDASQITIATTDGASSLAVSLAEPGKTVSLSQANASPRAVANAARSTFSNVGTVFIGKAPASGLCLSVEYFAPDESSNSLFVSVDPTVDPERLNLKVAPEVGVAAFASPVVPAGKIGAFALTRREERVEVKSVSFRPC